MIISLFGPDGVGKSVVSGELKKLGWTVFSGTNIASWPDKSWHESFLARGIDESCINDESHFAEKIKRLHVQAYRLSDRAQMVVIDSNPLHKTLIHDYLRSLPDIEAGRSLIEKRFNYFKKTFNHDASRMVHVYFQVSDVLPENKQAEILHDRVSNRDRLAYFDPKNKEQSLNLIHASREVRRILQEAGEKVVTITTDKVFNSKEFQSLIDEADNLLS